MIDVKRQPSCNSSPAGKDSGYRSVSQCLLRRLVWLLSERKIFHSAYVSAAPAPPTSRALQTALLERPYNSINASSFGGDCALGCDVGIVGKAGVGSLGW